VIVTVTTQQAELLASFERAVAHAIEQRNTVLNILSMGHVPDGSVLLNINTRTGELTFKAPEAEDG